MPSPLRNPKNLSEWFELDYFRRRRLFRGLWRSLAWGALLIAVLGLAWTFLIGRQTSYQAGPLSTAHAMFNHDCAQCHTQAFPALNRLWTKEDIVRSVPDSACLKCHDGPLHHQCAQQRNCAVCHHEHRGQAALARVADSQCISCHADLKRDDGSPIHYEAHVTGFAAGQHPQFRLWQQGKPVDPGKLRFNHKVHLDGVLAIDVKQQKEQRDKLRQMGIALCEAPVPKKQVRLECQSCHERDATGRFMQPVNYQRHCQECHPLSVQLAGDWKDSLKETACAFADKPTPHPAAGQNAETVRAAVRERLTRFILDPSHKAFLAAKTEPDQPARSMPGWIRSQPVPSREFAWVNHQLEQIERVLFDGGGGCRHCHQEKTEAAKRPNGLPIYEAPGMLGGEQPWYAHAVFDHASHQMLACTECHAAADSITARDVLLPTIETCQRCHNESGRGARADCVECHRYHDPILKRQFQGTQTIR